MYFAHSLLTLNGSFTATAYDEDASHVGARNALAPADGSKTSRPPPALNEGRDTLRRSLAILFAALVSLLGASACAGAEEDRLAALEDRLAALEDRADVLEDRVAVLEELVEEVLEEELEEAQQQEQTQQEQTQ